MLASCLIVLIIGFGVSMILTIRRESALLVDEHKASVRLLTTALIPPGVYERVS